MWLWVSFPCTPPEPQNTWQMHNHPPQNGIGSGHAIHGHVTSPAVRPRLDQALHQGGLLGPRQRLGLLGLARVRGSRPQRLDNSNPKAKCEKTMGSRVQR